MFVTIEKELYTVFDGKLQWLKNVINFSNDSFFQFLIATLGVAGFLVALFYANLSGVFTSKYANLDFNISKARRIRQIGGCSIERVIIEYEVAEIVYFCIW